MPTLREIATQRPAAVRVFEKYDLDYCCGGNRPLEQVCGERGLSPAALMEEVEAYARKAPGERDWTKAPLPELIGHIVTKHHVYLNNELPVIEQRMAKVLAKHGANHPDLLGRLADLFAGLKAELEVHLRKEEMILFPAIEELEAAAEEGGRAMPVPFGTVKNPIRMMEHEHDAAGTALRTARELTHGYVPPEDACPTFRALYHEMEELERDLHTHIHLENNILFPRAGELEAKVR